MTGRSVDGDRPTLVTAWAAIEPTPDEFRVWMPETRAREVLRCAPEALDELRSAGLAANGTDVERFDVWNTGLLNSSCRPAREMVFFSRLLRSDGGDWLGAKRYSVLAEAVCPLGADCTSDSWTAPPTPGVTWETSRCGAGEAMWRGRTTLSGRASAPPSPRARDVWNDLLNGFRFQFTPRALALRPDLIEQRRSGDCLALSHVLAERLAAVGLDAVVRHGYIFGGSSLRDHDWVSYVDDDGSARDLDPSMALLADRFFTAGYREFCAGSRLNRILPLADDRQYFVDHPCVPAREIRPSLVLRPDG